MTISQGGYNDNLPGRLFYYPNGVDVPNVKGAKEIPIHSGVRNPERFYSKPNLQEVGKSIGDIDGFTHWNGHYLLMEFKPSTWLSNYDRNQIRSQIALVLEARATYWIIHWRAEVGSGLQVAELIEIAPDGKTSLIKTDANGLRKKYKDWRSMAEKTSAPNSKWKLAGEVFDELKERNFNNDDTEDGTAAIH
ncbi:hypothetical protein [Bacillus mycoides]|uniref:hypothetical protein n=1 Tax=Bacillus mycoides TaxID=1405 RepID=UPI0003E1EEAC|nr:hypothetical protein [Bacillus mycoides]ETT85558.1 hypothetical protein C174_01709 [Bacillus mycoides FSL H7-687]